MSRRFDTVDVHADLKHFAEPLPMGTLRCQRSQSGDVFSFEYDAGWLTHPEAFAFDPDLSLVTGAQ